jgi:hypothetical protein
MVTKADSRVLVCKFALPEMHYRPPSRTFLERRPRQGSRSHPPDLQAVSSGARPLSHERAISNRSGTRTNTRRASARRSRFVIGAAYRSPNHQRCQRPSQPAWAGCAAEGCCTARLQFCGRLVRMPPGTASRLRFIYRSARGNAVRSARGSIPTRPRRSVSEEAREVLFVQFFWIDRVWPPTPTSSSVFCRCW